MPYEYKVDIAGTEYGMQDIQSVNIQRALFDTLSVGNTCCAKMDMVIWPLGEIPRMAKIIPYSRKTCETEWVKLGEFFISKRRKMDDVLKIVAYDGMLKSESEWVPRQSLEFPMTMRAAAEEIASLMETELDPRCEFDDSYTIDYPANGYVLRDILRFIASAHAGNWIMTQEGKLLLIPLFGSMPEETNYLVTENGSAIVIGGVRLLV